MYRGTITVELGGMSIADVGRDTFGVIPGVPPGVAGLGFLFCRILRNSLKRPMIIVGPEGFAQREYERRSFHAEIEGWQDIKKNDVWPIFVHISPGGVVFIGGCGSRRAAVRPHWA